MDDLYEAKAANAHCDIYVTIQAIISSTNTSTNMLLWDPGQRILGCWRNFQIFYKILQCTSNNWNQLFIH